MILIPKYRLGSPPELTVSTPGIGLRGEFKFTMRDLMGRVVMETDWEPNLITDRGLDMYSWYYQDVTLGIQPRNLMYSCDLGDGVTPVSPSDTQLANKTGYASANWLSSPDTGYYAGAPNYEKGYEVDYRSPAGVATGWIREIGCHPASDINLFTRSLVSVPFEKGVDHILDVSYRVWGYPEPNDHIGTVTLDGEVFDTIVRWASVGQATAAGNVASWCRPFTSLSGYYGAGDCTLAQFGDWTTSPSVTYGAPNAYWGYRYTNYGYQDAYTPGQHYMLQTYVASIDRIAYPEGTGNMTYAYFPAWMYRVKTFFSSQVDGAGVPKDNTNELILHYKQTWGRYTP